MIHPELFVLISIFIMFINGILHIIAGAMEAEKKTKYGILDVLLGIFVMCLAVLFYII